MHTAVTPCKRTRRDLRRAQFEQFKHGRRESNLFQSTWPFLSLSPRTSPLLCLHGFRFGKRTRPFTGANLQQLRRLPPQRRHPRAIQKGPCTPSLAPRPALPGSRRRGSRSDAGPESHCETERVRCWSSRQTSGQQSHNLRLTATSQPGPGNTLGFSVFRLPANVSTSMPPAAAAASSALRSPHGSQRNRGAGTFPLVGHADVGQEAAEHQERQQEEDHVPL